MSINHISNLLPNFYLQHRFHQQFSFQNFTFIISHHQSLAKVLIPLTIINNHINKLQFTLWKLSFLYRKPKFSFLTFHPIYAGSKETRIFSHYLTFLVWKLFHMNVIFFLSQRCYIMGILFYTNTLEAKAGFPPLSISSSISLHFETPLLQLSIRVLLEVYNVCPLPELINIFGSTNFHSFCTGWWTSLAMSCGTLNAAIFFFWVPHYPCMLFSDADCAGNKYDYTPIVVSILFTLAGNKYDYTPILVPALFI